MSFLDSFRDIGAIAGLSSLVLQMHQSRRNRPSFAYTPEGTHAEFDIRDNMHFHDFHFEVLIRNASQNANTIARLYLVVWKDGDLTKPLRFGNSPSSLKNVSDGTTLTLPLRMEGRSAIRADIVFPIRLTGKNGQLTWDGEFSRADNPRHSEIPKRGKQRSEYQMVFEDAAGNYFSRSGRLLSRPLMNLYTTLSNYEGRKRIGQYFIMAEWWLKWKWAHFLSLFGFYR